MENTDIENILKDNEEKVNEFLKVSKINSINYLEITPRDKAIRSGHNRTYKFRGTYIKFFETYIL
jgi:hypothetical protein